MVGRLSLLGLACAAAMLLVVAGPASAADRADTTEARQSARTVRVTTELDLGERGRLIPRSFVGLSLEYPQVPTFTGHEFTGVNQASAGLLANLTRAGNGPPVIRVGGGSQDSTWWNPDAQTRPFGIDFDLTPEWIEGVSNFYSRTRTPLILGLNLVQHDRRIAKDVARALMAGLPRGSIRSFEVGNEPDIYAIRPLGVRDGRTVFSRPRGYGADEYLREIGKYLRSLRRMRPRPRLAGPTASCSPEWCDEALRGLVRRYSRHLEELTFHTYATNACPKRRGQPGYSERGRTPATIPALLSNAALRDINLYKPAAEVAERRDLGIRISETNSGVCGGTAGMSDTFASALWAVDWMFLLAANGMTGVNFHASSTTYAPFTTGLIDGEFLANARPLYYGMLLFSEATARRARVLIHPTLATRTSSPANIRVWATLDRRRRTARIVVVNKDSRRGSVRIEIPRSRRSGTLVRLSAPSLDATEGVSLGGRSVPIPTADGELTGSRETRRVRPRRGVYRLTVPAGSAAMLTVPRVPRARR